ncbi:MAG: CotH kinase family protein [Defluviitaleaceae bacterium]|nr:CotH kinase family protein [Defluviitaleaceae bacterium]
MKRFIVLALALVVLVGAALFLDANPIGTIMPESVAVEVFAIVDENQSLSVAFSETEHFFADGVTVSISASNSRATIHYTLDGSQPTRYSKIYTSPLNFNTNERVDVSVLRAIAVYGEEVSQTLTHTFFVGWGVHERFDTLVFSFAIEHDYLYCFYTGIMVEGITRQNFILENPGAPINPLSPANFTWRGRESERPVYMEVFNPNGELVLEQAAGLRIFGSWSRGERIKSLRIIARREYSPHAGRFNYGFFPNDLMRDGFDTPITRYNTLILRNGGNDRQHGILRNELGSELARRAGFLEVTPARAATVFINGEFYGFKWLQVRVDTHFFQELYGTPSRDFDVIGRGEWWFRNATEEQELALTLKNSFAFRDLTNDAVFAQLETIVDVENLLWYYAFQIFLGNGDWPYNNLRRWRYTGEQFEGAAPELDGRWRYAMFDLDQTFGLFGQNYRRPTFQYVLTHDNDRGQLIRAILQRQDMAELFTMMMCDIAANVVNYEIVREVLEELYGAAYNEMGFTMDAGLLNPWVSRHSIGGYHERTLHFAERRYDFMFDSLAQLFDFERDMFDVFVVGGKANIGSSQGVTSSRYFAHLTIPVSPALPQFTAFDHWILNGERVYDETIFVTYADAVNGAVEIELVTRPDVPLIMIHSAVDADYGNRLVLVNTTNSPLRTDGLFLSNNRQNLQRFMLPAVTIEPNGTLEFVGNSSRNQADLFQIRMNFNVRDGRRIFLSDIDGNILDSFIIL